MSGPLPLVRQRVRAVDQRWQGAPIRTRLTAAAAFSATMAIVAVVAAAYLTVRHELLSNIDGQLRAQANNPHYVDLTGPRPVVQKQVGQSAGNAQIIYIDGQTAHEAGGSSLPVSSKDVAIARDGGSWLHTVEVRGTPLRVLTVQRVAESQASGTTTPVALQVALPLTAAESELHKLTLAFLVLVLLGLGMTTVGSWFVVRRTMRPVASLTEAAEQIAETRDLTTRIDVDSDDELGRLASTFNTMLDALERSLGQQRQLILDASHELRTPLASLRTNVEVLNDIDRLTPVQRRGVLDGIVTQLDELTGLVADVVELARGDVPGAVQEDIAFDDLVSHAVDRARRHWPNVIITFDAAPVRVRGVSARLDRAVANLLDNAGKFSPAGATVAVRLTADGALTVADDGPGVPEDAIPHVFDRFYRADEARALPGSGLGLAIVKQVLDGHGGTIALSNRSTRGTVARMTLPVLAREGDDEAPVEEPAGDAAPVG